ncbi:single-stranded DNA-binding protein [Candidatus Sordicultor fermentans]|uniref:single-stranded DNA-binding protein n=1 Tax=Candidatus Sordicultor fermentans TaxID=1953203 RepID=UPI001695E81B|nr:single-stranded DNA-binding protein [Candidatus Atribacteria bacterium]
MARDINCFFGIGNLTKEPDLRYTPQGTPVCRFSIAMNRSYSGKQGMVKDVTYITVAAWSKLAEICARYLHKGSRVAVMGELRSSSWEDREGNRRISYEIRADNVQFLSPPRGAVQEEVEEFSGLGANFEMEEAEPFVYEGGESPLGELEDIPLEKDDGEEGAPF